MVRVVGCDGDEGVGEGGYGLGCWPAGAFRCGMARSANVRTPVELGLCFAGCFSWRALNVLVVLDLGNPLRSYPPCTM